MNYDFMDELDGFEVPHLPLDWNEELSLEDYLARMEENSEKINQSFNPKS